MQHENLILFDDKKERIYILYNNKKIEVKVLYKERKTISIRITPKNNIEVLTPKSVPFNYLKDIFLKKMKWILRNLDNLQKIDESYINRDYKDDDKFYYLGKELKLKISKTTKLEKTKKDKCIINVNDDYLEIITTNINKEYIKNQLKQWYKTQSEKIVELRINHLKKNNSIFVNLNPNLIKIKEQKKRWGSCTSSKKIYINSKISMAKLQAIDYIIVHEFAHLANMNHSKEFYNLVESIMPNYKEAEIWLKQNSYKLVL